MTAVRLVRGNRRDENNRSGRALFEELADYALCREKRAQQLSQSENPLPRPLFA